MAHTSGLPCCPYAVRGLDSPAMRGCPGFAPETVHVGADLIVGTGVSCRHLRAQRNPRRRGFGFVSACTHPLLAAGTAGQQVSEAR